MSSFHGGKSWWLYFQSWSLAEVERATPGIKPHGTQMHPGAGGGVGGGDGERAHELAEPFKFYVWRQSAPEGIYGAGLFLSGVSYTGTKLWNTHSTTCVYAICRPTSHTALVHEPWTSTSHTSIDTHTRHYRLYHCAIYTHISQYTHGKCHVAVHTLAHEPWTQCMHITHIHQYTHAACHVVVRTVHTHTCTQTTDLG